MHLLRLNKRDSIGKNNNTIVATYVYAMSRLNRILSHSVNKIIDEQRIDRGIVVLSAVPAFGTITEQ